MLKRTRTTTSSEKSGKRRRRDAEQESSLELGLAAERESSPELGLSTPALPSRSLYSNLTRAQLGQLLRARGVTPQQRNKRNKEDYLQRLLEFDEKHPNSPLARNTGHLAGQKTPQQLSRQELREELKARGLPLKQNNKRKKADLLQRLLDFDAAKHTPAKAEDGSEKDEEVESTYEQAVGGEYAVLPQGDAEDSPGRDGEVEIAEEHTLEEVVGAEEPVGTPVETSIESDGGPPEGIYGNDADDEDGDDTKSRSPSPAALVASSPPASREPARWMVGSPSPARQESDVEYNASRASSRSPSPISSLQPPNEGDNSSTDSTDADSDTKVDEEERKADEEREAEEEHKDERVDIIRTPSPTPPYIPPSPQPERVPSSQPSSRSMQVSASQPLSHPTQLPSRTFPSVSQPAPMSLRSPTKADGGRLTRPGQLYTSLKDMLNKTRGKSTGAVLSAPTASMTKTGNLSTITQKPQKKLPAGLADDSGDDETSEDSSSSDDEL